MKSPDLSIAVSDRLAADDYHAFEMCDDEAATFLAALEARTDRWLSSDDREGLEALLRRLQRPFYGYHERFGDLRYVYFHPPDVAQGCLARQRSLTERPTPILDLNAIDPSGTTSLEYYSFDDAGQYVAYITSHEGSDRQVLRVHDVEAGCDLAEQLDFIKFGQVAWEPSGAGFLYNRYASPDEWSDGTSFLRYRVCRHRLGTDQSADELVWDWSERPEMIVGPYRERLSDTVFIGAAYGADNKQDVYWRDAGSAGPWRAIQSDGKGSFRIVGTRYMDGRRCLFALTDRDAPNGRVVMVDLEGESGDSSTWRTVVSEGEQPIVDAMLLHRHLILVHHTGRDHQATRCDIDGANNTTRLPLRDGVSLGLFREHPRDQKFFASMSSWTSEAQLVRIDPEVVSVEPVRRAAAADTLADVVTRVLDIPADDGEVIPATLIHGRETVPGPHTPALMYGYGGFGIPLSPSYDPMLAAFLGMGGVYVNVHIRGGGEKGRRWHDAALGPRRQRAFDDFMGCADYLVAKGFTSRSKLAIYGTSNGGLLVAACLTQRPDLCGAVICDKPVTDMLRFPAHYAGVAWVPEYGSPELPELRVSLRAYSPLHNVPRAKHAPVLILTAEGDDRVAPWHATKFAAALVHGGGSPENVYLKVQRRTGHGSGRSRQQQIEHEATILAFLRKSLQMERPILIA